MKTRQEFNKVSKVVKTYTFSIKLYCNICSIAFDMWPCCPECGGKYESDTGYVSLRRYKKTTIRLLINRLLNWPWGMSFWDFKTITFKDDKEFNSK